MNYYFLVEDEKSSMKVLPYWLTFMGFPARRVEKLSDITQNCYIMRSGMGCYNLVDHVIPNTIAEISQNGKIDCLVIVIDSESYPVSSRFKHVQDKCKKEQEKYPINCEIKIFVVNCCFETWLLGNISYFPKSEPSKTSTFYPYYKFFNVSLTDPEDMQVDENNPKYPDYHFRSRSDYHFRYFHDMCLYNKVRYSKSKPDIAKEQEFFDEIIKRIKCTNHLNSFRRFYEFIKETSEVYAN